MHRTTTLSDLDTAADLDEQRVVDHSPAPCVEERKTVAIRAPPGERLDRECPKRSRTAAHTRGKQVSYLRLRNGASAGFEYYRLYKDVDVGFCSEFQALPETVP